MTSIYTRCANLSCLQTAKVVVVTTYGIATSRFIESEYPFTLVNRKEYIAPCDLSRRQKAETSNIDEVDEDFGNNDDEQSVGGDAPPRNLAGLTGCSYKTYSSRRTLILNNVWDKIKKANVRHPPGGGDDTTSPSGYEDCLKETLAPTKMLRQYFAAKGKVVDNNLEQWVEDNMEEMPVGCEAVWKASNGLFDRRTVPSGKGLSFSCLVYDEGHILRNQTSTPHFVAQLIPADALLILSGTALFNNISDAQGYVSLFAKRSGIDKHLSYSSNKPINIDHIKKSEDVVQKGLVGVCCVSWIPPLKT